MDQRAAFWNRQAASYARKPVPSEEVYERKLAMTRQVLRADATVLEVGCGTGSTALRHAPYVARIDAIDFSHRMIEIAKAKAAASGVQNVSFECSAVDALSSWPRDYDAVLALSVLHLLRDWRAAIESMRRLIRPGGVFVSSTPCLGDRMGFFRWMGPVGHRLGVLPDVQVFSQAELKSAIADAGFQLEQVWHPGRSEALFILAHRRG